MTAELSEAQIASLNVLAVDDEEIMLKMIEFSLKSIGIKKFLTAPDGIQALSILDRFSGQFDLIICDWEMPNMNGLELLKEIRARKIDTRFLVLTGNVTKEAVSDAVNAGANAYVAKPFTVDQLSAKVKSLMKK